MSLNVQFSSLIYSASKYISYIFNVENSRHVLLTGKWCDACTCNLLLGTARL